MSFSGYKRSVTHRNRIGRRRSQSRRYRPPSFEQLESRLLLTHGPLTLPDGSVEITLDDAFDQFGFQPAIFQAFDSTSDNGFDDGLAGFSIFDTGASVVTFGADDQLIFSLLGAGGIPVQVECGAVAEAVGGLSLVGHISQRGTVLADGLHVSTLSFDEEGFPVFQLGFHDPQGGTVSDPLLGNHDFSGNATLSAVDDQYTGFYLSFTTGPMRGEVREIVDYAGPSRRFSFRSPFSQEPASGDRFLLTAPVAPFVSQNAGGTVVDSSPAAHRFSGDAALSGVDNSYQGLYLQFTGGVLAGQMQQITDYTGATRTFHFSKSFSAAPTSGDSFNILQINTTPAAIAEGIQAFVGAHVANPPEGCPDPASPTLPTISGTPMLNPSASHPDGLAANIRPFGAALDFSGFAGFEQFIIPVPDVHFQDPGQGIPHDPACLVSEGDTFRSICTGPPMRIPLEFLGGLVDEDGKLTEAYNPVHNHVTARHRRSATNELVELENQTFLFDTGAQLSVISPAIAEAFGLDLNSPEDTISVQTAGGVITDLPGYRIDSLTVPMEGGKALTFNNVWVFVVDAAPGLLDGILGMNLFNLASAMVYDPWHPDGPVLELQYFTEHLFDLGFAEVPEIEPNNVPAEATPIRPGEYGVGELPAGDIDYWATPGASEGDLIFAYVDTQQSTASKDAVLTVFDKNENLLASDDNDGPGPSPVVAGVPVPTGLAGTVYYQVAEAGSGSISEYAIYAAVVDPVDVADEGEVGTGANDSTSTATPISRMMMTGMLGGSLGSGDADYYKVLATEGARLVVMMDNDPDKNSSLTSTRISIHDPNGTEVFPPTAGGGDGNATASGAVLQASQSGEYLVEVTEGTGGLDNDYRFVTLILDGGSALLAANLIQTAESKREEAQKTVQGFEDALKACGADLFCQIDVLVQYTEALLQASEDLAQAEVVLAFASTITPGSMPTFVGAGLDLDLSIEADSISETGQTMATVRRLDTSGDLTVTLTSSDTSAATVQVSVIIPDGKRTSLPFAVGAVDDPLVDGTQTVTITAAAPGYQSGVARLDVVNDDQAARTTAVNLAGEDLLVAVFDSAPEGANDTLTVDMDGTDLLVGDPNHPIESTVTGSAGKGTNELKVPLSVFSGSIVVETKSGDDLLVLGTSLTSTLAGLVVFHAGAGDRDKLLVRGGGKRLDVSQFTGVDAMDITGTGSNSLQVSAEGTLPNLENADDALRILSDADDSVVLSNGWTVTGTLVEGGVFFRILKQAEATIHLSGPRDWQNPIDAHDINADGTVVPLDVLAVINQLNSPTFLGTDRRLVDAALVSSFPMRFFDVDGNGFGTPLDALRVINFLNNRASPEGEDGGSSIPRDGSGSATLVIATDPWLDCAIVRNRTIDNLETRGDRANGNRVEQVAIPREWSSHAASEARRAPLNQRLLEQIALDELLAFQPLEGLIDELARGIRATAQ